MTFELLDPADNPYLPRYLQDVSLNLNPDDFALLHPPPEFLPDSIDLMDGAHGSALSTAGPVHDDMDAFTDDIDDNSSESLVSIEDDEYPSFFAQRGSPPRLFHSHGTYILPVDSDEMKVCTTIFGVQLYSCTGVHLEKKFRSRRLEARSSTHPAPYDPRKQL